MTSAIASRGSRDLVPDGIQLSHEDAVRAQIREMAARDAERERFGARTHRYALAPHLPETEIRAFEESHSIVLPAEYRSFVAEEGNGPAGPGHGLMPLTVPRPEADEEWAGPGVARHLPCARPPAPALAP